MSNENQPPTPTAEEPEALPSRPMTGEEEYYREQAYKEPVEGIERIEEVAKFLIGATATTSGLFLAAFKLAANGQPLGNWWALPFFLWSAALMILVLVLLPHKYNAGQHEPASWKAAFVLARTRKYRRLLAGATAFIAGILAAAILLLQR